MISAVKLFNFDITVLSYQQDLKVLRRRINLIIIYIFHSIWFV